MNDYDVLHEDTYDEIAYHWDTKRAKPWDAVVTFLESCNDVQQLKLLDNACGNGRHMLLAHKLGFRKENIVGCDQSAKQLSALEKHGFKTKKCKMQKLAFQDDFFDVVLCIASLHHLLDPMQQQQAIKEMLRVTKKKGKIVVSVWMPTEQYIQENRQKGKIEINDENSYLVHYTMHEKQFDRYYYMYKENELALQIITCGGSIIQSHVEKGNLYVIVEKQ